MASTESSGGAFALPAQGGEVALPQVLAAIQDVSSAQSRMEQQLARILAALPTNPETRLQATALPLPVPTWTPDSSPHVSRRRSRQDFNDPSEQPAGCWGPATADPGPLAPPSEGLGSDTGEVDSGVFLRDSLPRSWPASIEPRSGFEESHGDAALMVQVEKSLSSVALRGSSIRQEKIMVSTTRCCSAGWALDPDSPAMRMNDVLGVSVLMHDLLLTPFLISWEVHVAGVLLGLAWTAGLYWTLDLGLGFTMGFYRDGELVLRQPDACHHYLRTGFVPNCLLVLVDWANLLSSTFAAGESFGTVFDGAAMLRVFKVIRLLKVLRLARLMRLLDKMTAGTLSSGIRVAIQVLKVVCGTILVSHLICCVWFLAGREGPTDTGLRWPNALDDFADHGHLYQYLTAFHWVLAQITLGSSDVLPLNWFERLFNIVLLVNGLLFGSTIVAIVSAQFVSLSMVKQDRNQALMNLRKFLQQHRVPTSLVVQVTNQAMERLFTEKLLLEKDVSALQVLSSTLRSELLCEIRVPLVLSHPLFRLWGHHDMAAVRCLCEEVTGFALLSRRDMLFTPGFSTSTAYCVESGRLLYTQFPSSSKVTEETQTDVHQRSWLCEAALWSHWVHVGQLEAVTSCQVLVIEADGLMRTLAKYAAIASVTKAYSRRFYARLASAVPPHAPWPSDVFLPFNATELLSKSLSIAMLRRAQRAGHLSPEQRRTLEEEVQSGRCTLQPAATPGWGLERIIALVAVDIEQEGRVFLQVGKWEEGRGAQTVCRLPGTKRASGEAPQEALRRLLRTDLPSLMPHIIVERSEHSVQRKESERLGLPTTYLRTVHLARLRVPLGEISMAMASVSPILYAPELGSIPEREVYVLPDGESLAFYCWLTHEERRLLEAPDSLAPWQRWLDSLALPERFPLRASL